MRQVLTPIVAGDELKRRIVEFVRRASTEISASDEALLPALSNKLPPGTTIYVAHTPRSSLAEVTRTAVQIQSLGFTACPHIVARKLKSEQALRATLRNMREGGVEQALLVAGDVKEPEGSFASTLEVLETGCLHHEGFTHLGVCGHPEGHKAIGPTRLWQALHDKQEYAVRTGSRMRIVTQFGFNPTALRSWTEHLRAHGINLPVHAGIAGPAPFRKLISFAMQCGVTTSLHALMNNMRAMADLTRPITSPDEMLPILVSGGAGLPDSPIVQPHFYSFGGVVATARWLRSVADGLFDLSADTGRFVLRS